MPAARRRGPRRVAPDRPHKLPGFEPPAPGTDPELDAVEAAIKREPNAEAIFGDVLRETYDQLYDGQRTGRYRWDQLMKTERTHMGTLVEINLQRAFRWGDGQDMDYGFVVRDRFVDVDCKFSQRLGGWEIPREARRGRHLCLVVWANEELCRWEAGLVRVWDDDTLMLAENQDAKRQLSAEGESRVRWMFNDPSLPANRLLHTPASKLDRIFNPNPESRRKPSGQAKVNMLFRLVQGEIVNRASVLTVAQQKDALKRARDARLPEHLGREGILVLGHQEDDPLIAEALGLPRPSKGSFISVRVVPAEDDHTGPAAEIRGTRWGIAEETDPVVPGPLVRVPRGDADD